MEINKTVYAIRHKESGLYYQSNDSDFDKFVELGLNIDLRSAAYSLDEDYDYCVGYIPDKYENMFEKYKEEDSLSDFYRVPPEDLELVEIEVTYKIKS